MVFANVSGQRVLIGGLVLCVVLLAWTTWPARDSMVVSPRAQELANQANDFFQRNSLSQGQREVRTKDFIGNVRGADPVLFEDLRIMHAQGQVTPENVQKNLNRG